ncbi:hypothetical protein LT493_23410 [Streptomyces tricolor]|nr:hypothetical protein [Streptomyces tricolor]
MIRRGQESGAASTRPCLHQLDVAGLIGITRVVLDTPLPGWAEGGGWSRASVMVFDPDRVSASTRRGSKTPCRGEEGR